MMKDETIKKLAVEIGALQNKLEEVEDKAKNWDFVYATGRMSKDAYLEQTKKEGISDEMETIKSKLESKKTKLEQQKRKYSFQFSSPDRSVNHHVEARAMRNLSVRACL